MWTIAAMVVLADPVGGVGAMQWLTGAWVDRRAGGQWTEEYWTPPRGGLMIGAGLTGKGEAVRHFEHMRIATDKDGKVAFFGMPNGAPAVAFPLVRQTPNEIVFENATHDYPQRVAYRREGERIIATVSLIDGTRENRWEYRRPN